MYGPEIESISITTNNYCSISTHVGKILMKALKNHMITFSGQLTLNSALNEIPIGTHTRKKMERYDKLHYEKMVFEFYNYRTHPTIDGITVDKKTNEIDFGNT